MYLCICQILKEKFGMVAPDVQIEDGKGTILISSEEGETEGESAVHEQAESEQRISDTSDKFLFFFFFFL